MTRGWGRSEKRSAESREHSAEAESKEEFLMRQ